MSDQSLTLVAKAPGSFLLSGDITHKKVLTILDVDILATAGAKVSIDFSGVTHSDSAGLALMTHWARLARNVNVRICFEQVPEKLLALAKMSGVDRILSFSCDE
ncbi:MAG TPA: STAS domain-containing protein [Gammaproteobacteria bacterium]|nr:STAS domain-containing protein [Gammaproteobacteria bacterium]